MTTQATKAASLKKIAHDDILAIKVLVAAKLGIHAGATELADKQLRGEDIHPSLMDSLDRDVDAINIALAATTDEILAKRANELGAQIAAEYGYFWSCVNSITINETSAEIAERYKCRSLRPSIQQINHLYSVREQQVHALVARGTPFTVDDALTLDRLGICRLAMEHREQCSPELIQWMTEHPHHFVRSAAQA